MRRWVCLFCFCIIVCMMFVGCGNDDAHNVISCADVIASYEEAGCSVWHKEYPDGDRDYLCEVSAENEDGDTIYFTFYDSAVQAEEHAKQSRWDLLLWAYSLVSGDPTWVHTETYDTIAIQYENADMYAPFEELK